MAPDRRRVLQGFAWLVATVATTGSLYFSLGLGLVPCELCWYQRILMYPLVVVIGVATVQNRRGVHAMVLPLSVLGMVVSGYHSAIQVAANPTACGFDGSCAAVLLRVAGLSIPNMALVAFTLITLSTMAVFGYERLDRRT